MNIKNIIGSICIGFFLAGCSGTPGSTPRISVTENLKSSIPLPATTGVPSNNARRARRVVLANDELLDAEPFASEMVGYALNHQIDQKNCVAYWIPGYYPTVTETQSYCSDSIMLLNLNLTSDDVRWVLANIPTY